MFKDNIKHICRILALILLSAGWAAGATAAEYVLFDSASPGEWFGDGNGYFQSVTTDGASFALSSTKAGSQSDLKAPSDYTSWRVYKNSSIRIKSETVPMRKVIVTYESGNSSYINECELSEGWTGNLEGNVYKLTSSGLYDITLTANNSQVRITRIAVSDEQGGGTVSLPAAPALSVASGNFHESFNLEMTCSTPGVQIYYTLDGTEPSAETGIPYTNPILIEKGHDWMVRAIAVNEYGTSTVTKGDYTYVELKTLSVRLTRPGGLSYYVSSDASYNSYGNDTELKIRPGSDIYVELYLNPGYKLKGVTLDGNPLEGSGYFSFTMGSSDMSLVLDTEFDPTSPSDPQPSDLKKKYSLTLVANPVGSATFNANKEYEEGERVYVHLYANNGYKFVNWTRDGQPVELNGNYFTMPASDVVLMANMEYNPNSPGDPEQPMLTHPLTATVSPAGAGTVNLSSDRVVYGEQWSARAYTNTGYRHIGWIVNGVRSGVTSNSISGTMTDKGVALVALYQYDPASPGDPNANSWNPETGVMIVDHFSQGNLYNTIAGLCSDTGAITHLIVKGVVSNYDYNRVCQLTGLQILDLSRTSGLTGVSITSSAETMAFPSTMTEFWSGTFNGNTTTTSIVLHATEPPVVEGGSFINFTNSGACTLYVPEESLPLYKATAPWKDFMIMPIVDDAYVLQVNLPDYASDGRYKHNSLELVNINIGVRQKYVISDRMLYTFNGLQKDEQYNIYMYSQAGLEIGRIENVIIPDEDIEVTFDNLKSLYTVFAKVLTSDGTDVTSQVSVEWLKPLADGTTTYLRKAVSLGEIPDGQSLICRVTLDDKHGVVYTDPDDVGFTVGADNNTCVVNLSPFRAIELTGSVVDGDGASLSGASVSVNQTLNDKYSKTYTAKTDRNGQWNLTVLDAPETRLTYAATECVNVNDTIGAFASDANTFDLGITTMKSIVGARVSYGFTYHAAGSEDVQDYYANYQNVVISVFNVTQNRAHKEVSLQYPILAVLDENINVGDELKLTATSKTGAFNPIEKMITIGDNQRAEVTFDIVGKGGISASFEMTDNPSVIAMLYDSNGELLKKMTYSEAKATFTELEDGDYTLVSMGQSDLMSSILRLSNYIEFGLTEGKDYVKNSVNVVSGKLSEVNISEVPAFDESLFYYTNSSTSFTSNKSSITTGNYLTLRAVIDFKGIYKNDISNVALIVDLPEGCNFVEQSVIQATNLLPYTLDKNRLTVQLGNNYRSQIRFCVIPTTGGNVNTTACIKFDYQGKTIVQPIGSTNTKVKDLEITLPSVLASNEFKVSGTGMANSTVNVYANDQLVGSGKVSSYGYWNVACSIDNPYNLSTHNVYAEIITEQGVKLLTETRQFTYDKNAIGVSKVTLLVDGQTIEWDFQNPEDKELFFQCTNPQVYTFTVSFTNNDPSRISNVIVWSERTDGVQDPIPAHYDEEKGLWVASTKYEPAGLGPVNVSIDFDCIPEFRADYRQVTDVINDYNQIKDTYYDVRNKLNECEELSDIIQIYENNGLSFSCTGQNTEEYGEYLAALDNDSLLRLIDAEVDSSSSESVVQNIDEVLKGVESFFIPLTAFSYETEDNVKFESKTCDGIDKNALIEQGFSSVLTTDNEEIFFLNTDDCSIYVDFKLNQYIEISKPKSVAFKAPGDGVMEFLEWHNRIQDALSTVRDAYADLEEKIGNLNNLLDEENEKFQRSVLKNNKKWQEYHELQKRTEAAIKSGKLSEKELAEAQSTIAKCNRMKDHFNSEIKKSTRQLKLIPWARKAVKTLLPTLERLIPIAKYVDIAAEGYRIVDVFSNLYSSIPTECKCDINAPTQVRSLTLMATGIVANFLVVKLATESVLDLATAGQVISSPLSGGASLGSAFATTLAKMVIGIALDCAYDRLKNDRVNEVESAIDRLRDICNSCKEPEDKDPWNNHKPPTTDPGYQYGGAYKSGYPNSTPHIDPSGFVYEAVPSNRIAGVQASCYYEDTYYDMYGDPHKQVVLWDAEKYGQLNPQLTNEEGRYRWDVPAGLWQVKYEKDGYQTTYSDWLPVPPPQLEVNIGIVQNKQPEVTEARAYEEGVEVQFDKYMDLSTLTTSNIYVTANGEKLNGEITFVDSALADENADEDDANALRYASRVRFVPEEKLSATTGEIRVTVSRNVLSYAGIPMTETFSQTLDVEKEVQAVYADDVKVLYGGEKEVTVYAMPYEAAVGRKLHITNSSDLIASIDITEATLDEEGKAVVKVKGDLPGRTQLTFTIDDVTATGECVVDVVTEIITAEAPKSSRASGTAVYRGTKIVLTSESKNATIYFTTDGSCPCDENGTRRKYTVPIVINDDNTKILAMTSVENGDDVSETVEFNYTLKHSDMDFQIPDGWTWVSHNMENPVAPSVFAGENVGMILGQTAETVRDPKFGFIGSLTEMVPTESYKLRAEGTASNVRLSDVAWNPASPIALNSGWNWLGYPVDQTMTVAEALQPTEAEALDMIVGQNGFAQFDGEAWTGTLATLQPGAGYMYYSASDKELIYNTSIVSKAAAQNVAGISSDAFAVDIHKYPRVMPVVAQLADAKGDVIDLDGCDVYAFSGTECRGIGRNINGKVMLAVYGEKDEPISFKVRLDGDDELTDTGYSRSFGEEMVGNVLDPHLFTLGVLSGIDGTDYTGGLTVTCSDYTLHVRGIDPSAIDSLELFSTEGRKSFRTETVTESGVSVESLPAGTYIVVIRSGESYSYHKTLVH